MDKYLLQPSSLASLPFQNYILISTALFVMITSLFNLLPFSRGDGYWILSDLTNKPNLSAGSIKKVSNVLKGLFSRKKVKWSNSEFFIFVYGLMNISFLSLFLYYTLIKNPGSIIYFPINIYNFAKNAIAGDAISLLSFRKLLIPIIFYMMAFKFLLSLKKKLSKI